MWDTVYYEKVLMSQQKHMHTNKQTKQAAGILNCALHLDMGQNHLPQMCNDIYIMVSLNNCIPYKFEQCEGLKIKVKYIQK